MIYLHMVSKWMLLTLASNGHFFDTAPTGLIIIYQEFQEIYNKFQNLYQLN